MLFEAELHKNRDTVLSFRLKGFTHEISACIKEVQKHHLVFIGYITCQQDFKHFYSKPRPFAELLDAE